MSLHPDILDTMLARGATAEMIVAAYRTAYELENKAKVEKRAGAAARKRAQRRRDGTVDLVDEMVEPRGEQVFIDAAIENEVVVTSGHTTSRDVTDVTRDKRNPHKENTSSLRSSEVKKDSGGSAGARTISDALDLADELGRMAGFEPVDCPPGWCGASQTIQKFFNGGCPADVIRTAIRAELKRLSGAPPPERFGWFEKPIARAFANFQRSVPVVAVPKMEIIDGGKSYSGTRTYDNGRPRSRNMGSATDAAARLCEHFTRIAEAEERAAGRMDRQSGSNDDGGLSA